MQVPPGKQLGMPQRQVARHSTINQNSSRLHEVQTDENTTSIDHMQSNPRINGDLRIPQSHSVLLPVFAAGGHRTGSVSQLQQNEPKTDAIINMEELLQQDSRAR